MGRWVETLSKTVDTFLPRIFLVIALPMVLFFAFVVPPFQVPDEFAHLSRADQISYGEMIGTRPNDKISGGYIETSYRLLFQVFQAEADSTLEKLDLASAIPLTGEREFSSFPNTIQYGPVMYIPQAAALRFARATGMTALHAFYLARCLNALAALAIAFWALKIARRGRFLIFCMLSMPMTLFLMGSISQDALVLTSSALFLSVVSKVLSTNCAPSPPTNLWLVVLLVALAWGRLPSLMLGVIFLLRPFAEMQWRDRVFKRWPGFAALACVIVLAGLWLWAINKLQINLRPSVSAQEQSRFLLGHIQLIPTIVANSLNGPNFLFAVGGLFGSIGVFNSKLPDFFYLIAFMGTAFAFVLETTRDNVLRPIEKKIVALALLLGVAAVYLALYLTWTPVGQLSVEGVQGRYLIPFILGSALVLPTASPRIRQLVLPLLLALPVVSIIGVVVSVQKVLSRYY